MNQAERLTAIKAALLKAFPNAIVEVHDESAQHIGHAGAASGAGHFAVTVATLVFMNQSLRSRHQMVYAALSHLMGTEIHALRIEAKTP